MEREHGKTLLTVKVESEENKMDEKKQKARDAVIRELMFVGFEGFGEYRSEVFNDVAKSVANNHEEYMDILNYLQCTF